MHSKPYYIPLHDLLVEKYSWIIIQAYIDTISF